MAGLNLKCESYKPVKFQQQGKTDWTCFIQKNY